ncbi:ATP-binding protein [Streptomyces sp. NPDC008222]|uniref:ATP-binding protein n=1 Tax=Streptomyces sp. NPDC008222 TaxID=3364820 RepID=UPI0036E46D9A
MVLDNPSSQYDTSEGVMENRRPVITPVSSLRVAAWLPADPAIVAHARALTAAVLSKWGLSEFTFTTQLIVSELVANVILHTPSSGSRLHLTAGNTTLRCAVSDDSRSLPRVEHVRSDEAHGRGLLLVSEIAHAWGIRTTATGKVVWAVQRIPARDGKIQFDMVSYCGERGR